MMKFQWSILLIVLSLVHIYASTCPNIDFCQHIKCEHGTCVNDDTISDCYRCECEAGYTGKTCDTQISTSSGCNPPCQNGGICEQKTANNFVCTCSSDYTGQQCETSILASHICVTNPNSVCLNGGICTINGAGYVCNCASGWSGQNCQAPITSCPPDYCGAYGNCTEVNLQNGDVFLYCSCDASRTGDRCETEVFIDCPIDICQNGGTCRANTTHMSCTCPPQFTGEACETAIPTTTMTTTTTVYTTTTGSTIIPVTGSCTGTSCSNGGTCYNTGNSFICLCKPNFSGPTCTIQNPITTTIPTTSSSTNACSPNPCNNGGTCYRHANSFVCVCSAAYTGSTCDAVKTTASPSVTTPNTAITCANQPCKNGAVCYNAGNSYFCYCGANSNYTGTNCDEVKPTANPSCPLDCSPGYCVQTGSSQNAYACMCNGALTPSSCSP